MMPILALQEVERLPVQGQELSWEIEMLSRRTGELLSTVYETEGHDGVRQIHLGRDWNRKILG